MDNKTSKKPRGKNWTSEETSFLITLIGKFIFIFISMHTLKIEKDQSLNQKRLATIFLSRKVNAGI